MNLDALLNGVVREIVNPLIWLLTGAATIIFVYGVLEFFMNFGGDDARAKGKSHMVWGIVGLTIMFGVFGILRIVLNTFGIDAPIEESL